VPRARVPLPRDSSFPADLVGLGLGANLGDPRRQLLAALAALSRALGALAVAPLYRTAPIAAQPQPDFLNTVVLACTPIEPAALLALAKELEVRAGRVDGPRWGPRPLDVDVLFVGERRERGARLELPHPRLRERAFVLAPLADLVPALPLPPDGRTPVELLRALGDAQRIERVSWATTLP
jgi:2-amino-4-hydroxy-6-hydroxymethyldihydropteridine diphosphokinase